MKLETSFSRPAADLSINIEKICNLISHTQLPSGEIPWSEGQKTDPWDHVEAAMGLGIGGYMSQAQRAFGGDKDLVAALELLADATAPVEQTARAALVLRLFGQLDRLLCAVGQLEDQAIELRRPCVIGTATPASG